MREPLLQQVAQAIATHHLLARESRVVVAVSGGVDSVALLHVLVALRPRGRWTLHAAHLDHGLRADSSADAQFVQELAARLRVGVTTERRDVRAACARHGWSLEDGARRIRYQFLLDVAKHQSAGVIALAHTADDQAETVLMRLVRGTGLLGLGAIPVKRPLQDVWVARPLLDVWRRQILAYATQAGLTYRQDPTNTERRFVRNRIRHELLPLLERDYNPNIKGVLTQLAEQSRWDYAYLDDATTRQWKRAVKLQPRSRVAISVAAFRRQPKAIQRQLVRRAIQQVRGALGQFEFRHWLEVERLFLEQPVSTVLALPGGVQWQREPDRVVCQLTESASTEILE